MSMGPELSNERYIILFSITSLTLESYFVVESHQVGLTPID